MDILTSLPTSLLAIIHGLVHEAGGLSSALALEGASRQLNLLLRTHARFQKEIVVGLDKDQGAAWDCSRSHSPSTHDSFPLQALEIGNSQGRSALAAPRRGVPPVGAATGSAASFWSWVAVHGHRLDYLLFDNISLQPHLLPGSGMLSNQAGVRGARAVAVHATANPLSLQLLGVLPCLQRLSLDMSMDVSAATGGLPLPILHPCNSLQALLALVGLRSLSLCIRMPTMSVQAAELMASFLQPLGSLSALTHLELAGVSCLRHLDFLSSLSSNLQRVRLAGIEHVTSLEPLSYLTNLTELGVEAMLSLPRSGLAPIFSLQRLQRLRIVSLADAVSIDLFPLSCLLLLQSLQLRCSVIRNLRPLAALGSTLKELEVTSCYVEDAEGSFEAVGAMTTATTILIGETEADTPICSNLSILSRLTNLETLMLGCTPTVRSLDPLSNLVALQKLVIWSGPSVSSLAPLSSLHSLRHLTLEHLPMVSSLAPIAGLTGLQSLRLHRCPRAWEDSKPLRALDSPMRRWLQIDGSLVIWPEMKVTLTSI